MVLNNTHVHPMRSVFNKSIKHVAGSKLLRRTDLLSSLVCLPRLLLYFIEQLR